MGLSPNRQGKIIWKGEQVFRKTRKLSSFMLDSACCPFLVINLVTRIPERITLPNVNAEYNHP